MVCAYCSPSNGENKSWFHPAGTLCPGPDKYHPYAKIHAIGSPMMLLARQPQLQPAINLSSNATSEAPSTASSLKKITGTITHLARVRSCPAISTTVPASAEL
ncbi:hypothetical protein FS749_005855 [Ceratobasidium sp. UAMH 11750]|nr:hypothetical protein FS749_005855 [Ceratobasidium sp. UAMH 11750]